MKTLTAGALGAALLTAACAPSTPPPDDRRGDFHNGARSESRSEAENAVQSALETSLSGSQTAWRAPNGDFGSVTPIETWRSTSGHWCRRFAETASFNGTDQKREAVACRVDGRWRLAEAL